MHMRKKKKKINAHEEGPKFLNVKPAGVPERRGALSKHFDDRDPIS